MKTVIKMTTILFIAFFVFTTHEFFIVEQREIKQETTEQKIN